MPDSADKFNSIETTCPAAPFRDVLLGDNYKPDFYFLSALSGW
jgi:hypothetical protein